MTLAASNGRRRQALGRGLGALIPGAESARSLVFCALDDIIPADDQPRTAINPSGLRDLADSIRQSGVLQPVLVRREGSSYRLIAGERRWRAARMAGLDKIPALVKDVGDDERFALALIENLQREDLTPLEEALAYRRLIDEHGYTQKSLAEKVGKGRSTIANTLRLLDLPDPVRRQVADGRLTAGHARAVLSVPSEERVAFANKLLDDRASVREAEAEARLEAPSTRPSQPLSSPPRPSSQAERERHANLDRLERRLRESLQTRVRIREAGGRGRVEIFFADDDTLQEIVDRLLK